MSNAPIALIPIRQLQGCEPVIIQPYASPLWGTTKRLSRCEIYALPETDAVFIEGWIYDAIWWMHLFRRDVTLWPVDVWSSCAFTAFAQHALNAWTARERATLKALRWAWGHAFAEELGQPPAEVETIWNGAA